MNTASAVVLSLALLTLPAGKVEAKLLGIQARVDYDLTQTKQRGFSATGNGRLSSNYSLTLLRPFLSTSTLLSDVSLSTSGNGGSNAGQSASNWTLNLFSDQSKYSLVGRVSRSGYGTTLGLLGSSGSFTTDYSAGLLLREPAYPVLNIQFLRNVSGTTSAGSQGNYTSTTWLMSSYYDMAPFRFSVDRRQQTLGYSGSQGVDMSNQTAAVAVNHTLMPGLSMSGELSRSSATSRFSAGITSNMTDRQAIRLSATPTRSVVADLALTLQSNDQDVGAITRRNNDKSVSCSLRAEILPGLSMDYADQRQSQTETGFLNIGESNSRNRSLSLAARLGEMTVFNITTTHSSYDLPSIINSVGQDSLQSTLQTSLSPTTDFSLNFGRTRSANGPADLQDSSFAGASIRDRTSDAISIGANYRRTSVRSQTGGGDSFNNNGDSVDMDLLWQPTYRTGVNLRLSYQNSQGVSASRLFSPSANFRWQIDSLTNLTANYAFQKLLQFETTNSPMTEQKVKGLSVRVAHLFRNGSSLDIAYDFQGGNIGSMEWRRQLRLGLTIHH